MRQTLLLLTASKRMQNLLLRRLANPLRAAVSGNVHDTDEWKKQQQLNNHLIGKGETAEGKTERQRDCAYDPEHTDCSYHFETNRSPQIKSRSLTRSHPGCQTQTESRHGVAWCCIRDRLLNLKGLDHVIPVESIDMQQHQLIDATHCFTEVYLAHWRRQRQTGTGLLRTKDCSSLGLLKHTRAIFRCCRANKNPGVQYCSTPKISCSRLQLLMATNSLVFK